MYKKSVSRNTATTQTGVTGVKRPGGVGTRPISLGVGEPLRV